MGSIKLFFGIYEIFIFILKCILISIGSNSDNETLEWIAIGLNVTDMLFFFLCLLTLKPVENSIDRWWTQLLLLLEGIQVGVMIPGSMAVISKFYPESVPGQVGIWMLVFSGLIIVQLTTLILFDRIKNLARGIELGWIISILVGGSLIQVDMVMFSGIGLLALMVAQMISKLNFGPIETKEAETI